MKTIMKPEFWKESVVYEIYPRSFMDSNNDGIGDIPGIRSKLDYLQQLGVDILWLTPVYVSPNADYGYDIQEHREIQPEYGTMDDWKALLQEVHDRGMKLIMDLVVNHTSDQHPWFQEALSSKDSPYRDYYIWRTPKEDGSEPNNWLSYVGDSMWKLDENSNEYYLHSYSEKQPDLNWENPKVRQEMQDMMRFWLDLGIDGYRIDAVNMISKDTSFPDAPPSNKLQGNAEEFYKNGPRIHEYLHELYTEVFSNYKMFTAGEASSVSIEDVKLYTNPEREEMNMVLMIEASKVCDADDDMWQSKEWSLHDLKEIIAKWEEDIYGQGWMGIYLSNHDHPRLVSYLGHEGEYRADSAKMLAMFLLTLRGTPYIYQGDEIGMTNAEHMKTIEDVKEQQAQGYYKQMVDDKGEDPEVIMERIRAKARDNARTPMQWDDSDHAGFSTAEPWIPVHSNKSEINVAQQLEDPDSIFNFYRKMIQIRKDSSALIYGKYACEISEDPYIFAYTREWNDEHWLIILNFSKSPTELQLPDQLVERIGQSELIIGTHGEHSEEVAQVLKSAQKATLHPYESLAFRGLSILDQ